MAVRFWKRPGMDYFREPRAEAPNDLPTKERKRRKILSCFQLRALKNFEADKLRIEGQNQEIF